MSRYDCWVELENVREFCKQRTDLENKFYRCFPPGRAFGFLHVLSKYPLKAAKERMVLKPHTRGHEIFGIMADHLLSTARKLGVPQVYLREFAGMRRDYNRKKDEEFHDVDFSLATFHLVQAIVEVSLRQ